MNLIADHCPGRCRPGLRYCLVVMCLAVSGKLTANQSTDPFSEEYFYEEVPVVLSATRLSQPVADIPAAITVIDKEMIKASGALEIPDLLRLVPGFQVSRYLGSKYSATYHGRADEFSRAMQVLVDGRSVYDPAFGGVSWKDLPLAIEDINRIEVIRGPNAAAYGSNSFSGVINIITEHPAEQAGTLVKMTGGSEDTHEVLLRHAESLGTLDYRVSVKYDENSGFDTRPDSSHTAAVSWRGNLQLDANDSLLMELGYSTGLREDGFYGDVLQPPRDTDHTYHFQQIRWNHISGPESEISLQFYHNYQKIDDQFQLLSISGLINDWMVGNGYPPDPDLFAAWNGFADFNAMLAFFGISDLPSDLGFGFESHRYDLELQHTSRPHPDLRLVWGAGARHDTAKSYEGFNTNSAIDRNQMRAFVHGEWHPIESLVFNIGAMYERYDGYGGLFSPRFAVNFHLTPNQTLRILASRAYRVPTLWEAHKDMLVRLTDGTPFNQLHLTTVDLDPEEITSYEVGYLGVFPALHLTFDAKLFRDRIDPLLAGARNDSIIDPVPLFDEGALGSYNIGELDLEGLELQLQFRITPHTILHAGYSHVRAHGWEVRRIDGSGAVSDTRPLDDRVPDDTFCLLASHRFSSGTQISAGYYRTGFMTWMGNGDDIPAHKRWDARLAQSFKLAGAEGEIALILQDIKGHYQEFNEQNETERRAYLQFGLRFR